MRKFGRSTRLSEKLEKGIGIVMNLHLFNGIEITNADQKLVRFMQSEYELYDGIPVAQDSTLSLFDILLSIMMNSRLDTASKVQSIWKSKKPLEEALSRIPTDVPLESDIILCLAKTLSA